MSSKKALKRDRRGGRRENAGRKPIWKNKDTITIRVPKLIATQVLSLAHRLDCEENIELNTESCTAEEDFVIQSKPRNNENITKTNSAEHEIITQSNQESQEKEYDFVTKSVPSYNQAIEIAKKILSP